MAELFDHNGTIGGDDDDDDDGYLTFNINTVIEMKDNGIPSPYVYKSSEKDRNVPFKYIFSFIHSSLKAFLQEIEPLWELSQDDQVLNKIDEESRLELVLEPRNTNVFDSR